MEGDSNSALFFLDASADSIGIGTTSPDSLLEVSGDSTGSITAKVTNTHDTDNTGLAVLQLENQRGADSNFYIEHNAYGQTKFYTGNSKNHSYTLEEDGDITLPDARRLQFGSDDTYIYATTDSDEHLMIAADASIWLDPDEDVVIRRAGTEWARFDGSAHSGEGQLQLGQGGDLQLYHDGSNSYIVDNGTGNLRLDGTSLWFNVAGSNIMRVESGQVKSWRDVNINDKITLDADTGALVAITKSFDIEHPTEEGKRLHHGVLEGPEHAVYIRGHQVGDTIELPDYWLGLVDEDTITVQLTAKGRSQNLYVKSVDSEKVVVGGFITKSPDFYYFIQAERKDIEKMVVEY